MLPQNTIQHIKYFTAHIQARPGEPPQKPQRQLTYLRALRTVPGLTVHLGQFLSHSRRMPRARPAPGGSKTVEVIYTEEKGSDVNLATHLLVDGFRKEYELAIVVTNDSDLAYPVSVVRRELKLRVRVIAPVLIPDPRPGRAELPPRRTSVELKRAANFVWTMDPATLAACQFPTTLTDAVGTFRKPATW